MGTGYNTEVLFNGERYHVQTEDKGPPRHEIVSHIYQGGAILLTKRLSYRDRLDDADRMAWTQEMTTNQHKAILKTIQLGGVPMLRAYIERENKTGVVVPADTGRPDHPLSRMPVPGEPPPPAPPRAPGTLRIIPPSSDSVAGPGTGEPPESQDATDSVRVVTPPLREPSEDVLPATETLSLRLLSLPSFRSGQVSTIKVLVTGPPGDTPVRDAKVIVQIFGMSFRPILFSGRTDPSGLFGLDVTLPTFTAGQASLNILAVSETFGMAELKYAIKK